MLKEAPFKTVSDNYKLKFMVIVPITWTAFPLRSVGENFHPRAALTAELLSRSCPLKALAYATLPSSSTRTSTSTAPLTCAAFANGG